MDAVAELVRQRHDVARLAEVIDQDVRVRRRRRRMGEGARRLAGPRRRVDPALVEEAPRDVGHARRKAAIGVEHRVARRAPGEDAARRVGQRRVAIPMLELRLAEPARLERVIAMRKARIGVGHRRRQRVDHLALDPIGEMARIGDVGELAPAVGDLLVLDQRVHDQGEQPDVGAERLGQRGGGGLARAAVGILQLAEQRLEGQFLARRRKNAARRSSRRTTGSTPRRPASTFRGTAARARR